MNSVTVKVDAVRQDVTIYGLEIAAKVFREFCYV